MSKKNTAPRLGNAMGAAGTLMASLTCIFLGLIIGFLALLILGWITLAQDGNALSFADMLAKTWNSGFKAILGGGFYKTANAMGMGVRAEILQAAPLIMTGLSVAFAFKTGLFNIGAAGQYTVGAYFALYSALILKMPWWVCLIASAIGATPLMRILRFQFEKLIRNNQAIYAVWRVVYYSILPVIFLLLSTAALVGDSYNPFIYFQF